MHFAAYAAKPAIFLDHKQPVRLVYRRRACIPIYRAKAAQIDDLRLDTLFQRVRLRLPEQAAPAANS